MLCGSVVHTCRTRLMRRVLSSGIVDSYRYYCLSCIFVIMCIYVIVHAKTGDTAVYKRDNGDCNTCHWCSVNKFFGNYRHVYRLWNNRTEIRISSSSVLHRTLLFFLLSGDRLISSFDWLRRQRVCEHVTDKCGIPKEL